MVFDDDDYKQQEIYVTQDTQKTNTCVCKMILNNLFHSGPKAKSIKKKKSFSTVFLHHLFTVN